MDLEALKADAAGVTVEVSPDGFDAESFRRTGVALVRGLLPPDVVAGYTSRFDDWYREVGPSRGLNEWNPVSSLAAVPEELLRLRAEPRLLDMCESIVGPEVGYLGHQLFLKDDRAPGNVFLHHDYCYQAGGADKFTAFIPLTVADRERGTLELFLGTHRLGYLGDAGEIRADLLPPDWPVVQPEVEPGDVVFMHCQLWHRSGPNLTGEARAFLGVTYQPAHDFTTRAVLRGSIPWTPNFMNSAPDGGVFVRSRSSRLVELQAFHDAHQ